jgi:hypothetical protein
MSDSVQSRSEGILRDTIDGTSEYPHKKGMSRLEDLLIELLEEGGGGTSDYTQLSNKPQINGHELNGNKTGEDLGLIDEHGNYIVVNGIRVYISATEPTGTIPDGSIWLGGVI